MKNKHSFRFVTTLLAALMCMTAFSTTAFAGGVDPDPEPLPEATEAPAGETTGGMEPEGVPLTPEGNATLVDDFYGDKQLITVTTKAGNFFYILIDRANEDKETAVHFLNQVDEADLMALMEDGQKEEAPAVCTCTTKCKAGAVNTACPVCKTNMTECTGPEPQPQKPEETKAPEKESKSGAGGLLVFLVVALLGGGAALYYFKFRKPKADVKGGDDLDEYDFGEDEDMEDDDPIDEETTPEQEDEE